ncbi:MAG: hypothetical protein EBZ48_18080, partial [Proteobacteria bacterium]|nr:hypothetical protein [Pseudomonadota bacterium]
MVVITTTSSFLIESQGAPIPAGFLVHAFFEGEWRPGEVIVSEEDKYYVHFLGEDIKFDEWLSADRVRRIT